MSETPEPRITAEDVARAADRVTIRRAVEVLRRHNREFLAILLERFLKHL